MTYVPLGIRTEYSFLDGMCRIEALVDRARALRLGSIGIADLHSTYGFVPFHAAARAAGIRPILGLTVRLQADVESQATWGEMPAFLQLLARDETGYRNLLRLTSRAEMERAGAVPAVGFQDLERFSAGVLALDGGRLGPVAQSLVAGQSDGAERVAGRLREIFGADGFCIEVQRQGAAEDTVVEPFIVHLAHRLNVPLVATTAVRYLEPSDAEAHLVLGCIRRGTTVPRDAAAIVPEAHVLRSDPEMRQLYRDLPEALANTGMVAERCQVELDLGTVRPLEYGTRSGRKAVEELQHDSERGACKRYGVRHYEQLPVAVRDRLSHELAVIGEMELASCFLIAQDVVRFAKEEGISIGPGHGAAAGSLVCYVTGITGIDPLQHGLLFERFVSRGTAGRMPEFEFDVAHRRRDDLVQLVLRRLGPERAVQAASLPTLSTRSVVREVAHAMGLSAGRIDTIARTLHSEGTTDLWQALDRSPELKRSYQEDAQVRRLLDIARRLEGLPRNPTLHAGGLLMAAGSMTDQAALQRTRSGDVVAQVTHDGAQALGLLRIDLAASRALTVLGTGMQLVAQRKGIALALETLPLEDEPTFRLLARGDTHGVVHLDGPSVQGLLRTVQPKNFDEIVAVLCLCRPGARATGLVDRYPAQGTDEGVGPVGILADARLKPIVAPTHGLVLYQEQIMEIAIALGGFEADDAEGLRQALQRRRIGDLARYRARFLRGAVENGIDLEAAEALFGSFLKFANFDFDKAHGTGAAHLAYAGAYLRAHYPTEFALALMQDATGQMVRLREVLADAVTRGIDILPVDVNRSARGWSAEGDAIRIGLSQVRRLGEVGAERVLDERRRRGPFASLTDFCRRLPDLARPGLEGLVKAGGMESLGLSRAQALAVLDETLHHLQREGRLREAGAQLELGLETALSTAAVPIPEVASFTDAELADLEREALDFSLRDDRLWRDVALRGLCDLQASRLVTELDEGATVRAGGTLRRLAEARTRRGERMAFLRIEDLAGELEVVVFPSAMSQLDARFFEVDANSRTWIVVEGKVEHQGEGSRLVAERLEIVSHQPERSPLESSAATIAASSTSTSPDGAIESSNPVNPPQPHAERPAGSRDATEAPGAEEAPRANDGLLFRMDAPKRPRSTAGTRSRRRHAS